MLDFLEFALDEGAVEPTRAHRGDAGADLYPIASALPPWLAPGEVKVINTGVRVAIPFGFEGKVEGKSSLAALGVAPLGGQIDHGYTGPIRVVLANVSGSTWRSAPGKAIAQLVVRPIALPTFRRVDALDPTPRGDGGFGSSGS